MNKGLQVHTIKEKLKAAGVDPSRVDVEAHVDPSLHLDENIRNMQDQMLIPRDLTPETQSQMRTEMRQNIVGQAEMLDEQRSDTARKTDAAIEAETVFEPDELTGDKGEEKFELWAENPDEFDIEGVDWHGF